MLLAKISAELRPELCRYLFVFQIGDSLIAEWRVAYYKIKAVIRNIKRFKPHRGDNTRTTVEFFSKAPGDVIQLYPNQVGFTPHLFGHHAKEVTDPDRRL